MASYSAQDYETVESRLKRFWVNHPTGAVITEVAGMTPDLKSVIIRACVWFDKGDVMPTGVGIAQEQQGGNGPNSSSWTENADTSAVGRALANCGYSGDKRPSREEMQKVNNTESPDYRPRQQPNRAPVTTPSSRFTDSRQTNSRVADAPRKEATWTDRDDAPARAPRPVANNGANIEANMDENPFHAQ